jgi:iron complex transport system substrate-binding protein
MRLSAFLFTALFAIFALAGCQPKPEDAWGGKPNPNFYFSVVSISPGATEILGSRAGGVVLLGRTAYCNWPTANPRAPIVMKGVKPNYEQIAQLHPAVVIYDDAMFSEGDVAKFKEMGLNTFAITGDTLEAFEECLYDFGRSFHAETTTSEYVDNIHTAVEAAKGDPPPKKLKVALMMSGSGSEHMIAGVSSFQADIVRKSQGEPVGPDSKIFVPVSAESLVAMNPDVIGVAGDSKQIETDPRLQTIKAIREKKVYPIDPDVMLRRGGRVDKLIRGFHTIFHKAAL